MRFLITNDDGYDAPGLLALHHALCPIGEVVIAAPAQCHSSKGHAVVTQKSIRVERRRLAGSIPAFVVHSSPADCVRLGLCALLDSPPDFVVAGINPGANMGVDVYYSGTVAAAREAAIMGVAGIAVSQYMQPDVPLEWSTITELARTTLEEVIAQPLAKEEFWNLNFPSTAAGETPKPLTYAPLCRKSHAVNFRQSSSDGDVLAYRYSGNYRQRGVSPNSDVQLIFAGHATATRLQLDQTARRT